MENKEDDIEVNKVSRCQMRRLKAKKKKTIKEYVKWEMW